MNWNGANTSNDARAVPYFIMASDWNHSDHVSSVDGFDGCDPIQ